MSIMAHGKEYATLSQVAAKLAELEMGNYISGRSDGRVTEQYSIFDALTAKAEEMGANSPSDAVEYVLKLNAWLSSHNAPVNPIEAELEVAIDHTNKGNTNPTFRWGQM